MNWGSTKTLRYYPYQIYLSWHHKDTLNKKNAGEVNEFTILVRVLYLGNEYARETLDCYSLEQTPDEDFMYQKFSGKIDAMVSRVIKTADKEMERRHQRLISNTKNIDIYAEKEYC